MIKFSSLTFLIPAYNDEATIERVIEEATEVGKRVAKRIEIVVVNDGSCDETGRLLDRFRKQVRIITHSVNQGYGPTIKELYYAGGGEWLFTIPGDYQVGAKELEKLMKHSRSADMIIGRRVHRRDPPNRLLVSWAYNRLIRLLFGVPLHDANSVRLVRRLIFKKITLTSSSAFVDAELAIRAKLAGYRVSEFPISHRSRSDRKRGGGNKWRTMWETVREMVKFAYEKNP